MDKIIKEINPIYLIAGAAALVAFLYLKKNGVQGITYNLAGAAVDAVNGIVTGTVVGLGQVVGIPATNMTQCQKDMANGNKWDASFSCDASTYLSWLAHGAPTKI